MEDGPPMFRQDFTCPALLEDRMAFYLYGAITHFGLPFQTILILTIRPLACPRSLATTNGVSVDVLSFRY